MTPGVSAQGVQGAMFDPSPVDIRQRVSIGARPIAPTDLLTLREPKGLSLSPDAKWVALVVGQAVYQTNGYRSGLFLVSTAGDHGIQSTSGLRKRRSGHLTAKQSGIGPACEAAAISKCGLGMWRRCESSS
jgi:hypothetical protein